MTHPQTWSAERVRAVMTTESRQKARALFLSTHRPFQRIRVDFCKERATAGFITEDELRQWGCPNFVERETRQVTTGNCSKATGER
jgi:hypothetical protein